jgi:hypothetical protein
MCIEMHIPRTYAKLHYIMHRFVIQHCPLTCNSSHMFSLLYVYTYKRAYIHYMHIHYMDYQNLHMLSSHIHCVHECMHVANIKNASSLSSSAINRAQPLHEKRIQPPTWFRCLCNSSLLHSGRDADVIGLIECHSTLHKESEEGLLVSLNMSLEVQVVLDLDQAL